MQVVYLGRKCRTPECGSEEEEETRKEGKAVKGDHVAEVFPLWAAGAPSLLDLLEIPESTSGSHQSQRWAEGQWH